jgi:predicted alternative tryptophan synthase beta-subunit
MTFLALVHTIDATVAQMKYFKGEGVEELYLHNYLGQTGIAVRLSLSLHHFRRC